MVIDQSNIRLKHPKAGRIRSINQEEINGVTLCIRKAFHEATGRYVRMSYFCDDAISAFCRRADARKLLSAGVLTPDELVYANGAAMWIDKCDSKRIAKRLCSQINKGAKHSVAFLVRNLGLFVAGGEKIAVTVRDIVLYSIIIRINAQGMGGIRSLSKREQDFINQWESEAFRMSLTVGSGQAELAGRIAVVTGAGSGLGRSLAMGLARAGAMVAVLDIDSKAAGQTKALFEKENKDAQVLDVKCDITKQNAVTNAFSTVLEHWGGLDILVNAAGLAPAYSLVDMPVDKWRMALEVNLTGYFLAAQEVARIMIRQGMGGNIINLSSKSGLEASVDNTAYNATKAGEIHMARGWALELGKHRIRVNSVAPGNVFEGSKIWNRQYIKTAAKKYGIKPQEVIPYYVNKTALKIEIKGQDVADAVVFLCSDSARNITGQTLVVDSGQVMVR
jgi:NAD(P)-dependent dehydrogenase (short-subunit alcohol dehydrogenase family)